MKGLISIFFVLFAFYGAQAEAFWQCTYSCGSRGQELKIGQGWNKDEAINRARRQICTQYEGGNPKYYQGCEWMDGNGRGVPFLESWECTFTCGSRGQEPKVGRGRNRSEAIRDAKRYTCTQYVGGQPQFFQGCRRLH